MPRNTDDLAANEFLLIQEISRKPARTQRDLSQSLGLSLGTTNLLIRRLVRKGLIKVTQLDWKRTQYLLTLKGGVEKTRKACRYTAYTWKLFRQMQDNIATALKREHEAGRRRFHLVAQDELLELLQETITELSLPDASFSFHRSFADVPADADPVLTATTELAPTGNRRLVSLVDFDNISFRL